MYEAALGYSKFSNSRNLVRPYCNALPWLERFTTRTTARVTIPFLWDLPDFELFATGYHTLPSIFLKKQYIYIFYKFDGNALNNMVTCCKLPETRHTSEEMYGKACGNTCGNAFKLGLKNFQNDMLHGNVNMKVSPNIWSRNNFWIIFFLWGSEYQAVLLSIL